MASGNNGKYSCFHGNRNNKHSSCEGGPSSTNHRHNIKAVVWFVFAAVTILFSAGQVFGQFTVQPMKLEPKERANKMITTLLRLHSYDANEVLNIDLKVVELDQKPDGSWNMFDPDPNSIDYLEGYDVSKLSSCRSWITLARDKVELGPLAEVPVEITIRIPPHASGFYAAGIIATMPAMNVNSDVGILLRYLVPVLIEIQGRVYPAKIELQNVDVVNVPPDGENPATTKLTVNVENKGQTFSRLKPFARIWGFQDGHWRLITRAEFRDTGIIPGVALNLEADINRPLPSGRYRVAGALYVDGRQGKAVEKEIDFVGDPSVQKASTDAPLDLAPKDLIARGIPDSRRVMNLEVYNASDETVNIQTLFGQPAVLVGMTTGTVMGQDLTCPDWLQVEPSQFTLKSFESKRIRVIADIPGTTIKYPWYYSILGLYAHYPDGQFAGLTTTNVCVGNQQPMVDSEAKIALDAPLFRDFDAGNSQYLVTTYIQNAGLSHFAVQKCRAGLVITSGDYLGQVRAVATLESEGSDLILPFERRQLAGVLDISLVPDGQYRFETNMEYYDADTLELKTDKKVAKSIKKQIGVQVISSGGRKTLLIIKSADEILPNEVIQVNW